MMIRSFAIAALLGAGVAAGLLLAWPRPAPKAPPATASSGVTAPVAAAAAEAWPICSSMESVAADADWAELDPDFAAGKRIVVLTGDGSKHDYDLADKKTSATVDRRSPSERRCS